MQQASPVQNVAYFPYRAARNRPYFKEHLRAGATLPGWSPLLDEAMKATLQAFGPEGVGNPLTVTCAMAEGQFSSYLLKFFENGQPLFHVAKPLREALRTCDLGDACGADLKLPFPCFYLHLGDELGLTFNQGAARLEGAFVQQYANGEIGLALVGELAYEPACWGERALESFLVFLRPPEMHRPLLEALQAEIAEFVDRMGQAYEIPASWKGRYTPAQIEAYAQTMAQGYAIGGELAGQNVAVTLECAKLVANVLLYLSQYPEDVEVGWQDGTPRGHVEKFARAEGKAREKALSRARNDGFTRIRRVGGIFERSEAAEEGTSPSAHLRRAHWRRQAYGPQLSLRKLLWIRAARVLGGGARERPYLVGPAPESRAALRDDAPVQANRL